MSRSNESRSCRILAIRLPALGNVVIILPHLNDVKRRNPDFQIDLLTRRETASIPRSLETCRCGDVRLLTRYEPARVAALGMKLVIERG